MRLFDAVAAEHTVRLRRHLVAGVQPPEAHRLASLEARERRSAALAGLEAVGVILEEPAWRSLLAAFGWVEVPGVRFPTEAEHEHYRPRSGESNTRLDPNDSCWDCGRPIGGSMVGMICPTCARVRVDAAPYGVPITGPRVSRTNRGRRPRRRRARRRAA